MNEDFVSFELAVKLKEKGFDEPCIAHYKNNQLYIAHYINKFHSESEESIDAPTILQVLNWLRKEKKLFLEIILLNNKGDYICDIYDIDSKPLQCVGSTKYRNTYEQTILSGIEYVIDNLI